MTARLDPATALRARARESPKVRRHSVAAGGTGSAGSASHEAAIFPRKLAVRVVLASMITEPNGRLGHGSNLALGVKAVQRIAKLHVDPPTTDLTLIPPSHNHEISTLISLAYRSSKIASTVDAHLSSWCEIGSQANMGGMRLDLRDEEATAVCGKAEAGDRRRPFPAIAAVQTLQGILDRLERLAQVAAASPPPKICEPPRGWRRLRKG